MTEEQTEQANEEQAPSCPSPQGENQGGGKTYEQLLDHEKAWILHLWAGIQYKEAREVLASSTDEEQQFLLMRAAELKEMQEAQRKQQQAQEEAMMGNLETQREAMGELGGLTGGERPPQ